MDNRFEKYDKLTIQEIGIGRALGMTDNDIIENNLFDYKNKLQHYAWSLEYNNKKISQEEANKLNKKYQNIMEELAGISEIDFSCDYWIDFNNYVDNGKKKLFSYVPDENYSNIIR